uniref:Uncharacterized protein n=1 Tax=Timema genevievae TaxID=629358 RepID=A0A7R9PRH1_TIMGE|nr:unnamed protein product [Timema genevievae]
MFRVRLIPPVDLVVTEPTLQHPVWSEHWGLELKKLICTLDQAISVFSSFTWGEIMAHKYLGGYLPYLTWTKGTNASHQIAAANCCCNLALGSDTYCRRVTKAAAPYLISHLESLNNLMVVRNSMKLVLGLLATWHVVTRSLGLSYMPKELSISQKNEEHLPPALAIFFQGNRNLIDNYVTSQALKLLSQRINIDDTKPQLTSTTALIRIIGNLVSEESGRSAMEIVSAYKSGFISTGHTLWSITDQRICIRTSVLHSRPCSYIRLCAECSLAQEANLILTWQDAAEHSEATDCPSSPFFSSGVLRPIQWRVEAVALRHELNHLFEAYCDVLGQGAQTGEDRRIGGYSIPPSLHSPPPLEKNLTALLSSSLGRTHKLTLWGTEKMDVSRRINDYAVGRACTSQM